MTKPQQTLVNIASWHAAGWFLQNSLDAYVALEGETLAWANETWTTLTGWTNVSSVGRPFKDFLFREDAAAAMAEVASLPQGGRTVFTYRIAAKARGVLFMRCHVVKGADDWTLMILRDISAERQRELDNEQARRVAAMVRTTAGVTPWRYEVAIDRFEIDPDFTEHADKANAEHMPGDEFRGRVHPDDLEAVLAALEPSLLTGAPTGIEFRLDMDTGGWRRVRSSWQGVRKWPDGRWDLVGVNADVTEIAESRDTALSSAEAARAAAETKSRFLANISHELRTPMNGVLGVLHLIRAEPPAEERARLVDQALASGAGLSDLLNDIIDFSDIEEGRLQLSAEPVNPAAELEKVLAMFRPEAEAKGVALTADSPADLGWVAADPARLRKMMFHFVSNAVKFTDAGKIGCRLAARGEGEERRLRLEVEDTGVGIADDESQTVFQHFAQIDGSMTRRHGGPGLGLAITRKLAELMGGEVGYVSHPGSGSTFWADIATPAAAAPAAAEAPERQAWLAGVRVLVVEDNAVNRMVATRMLGALGASVATAENGAEGVSAMERADFDLVFMDIQMPVMDGVEATRRIRAMPGDKGHVPIVATTANVMPEQIASYRRNGIDGVVAKPISPAALLSEVARISAQAA